MPDETDDPAAQPRPTFRARLAGLRVDVTPLRTSRDFRLLFSAGTVFYLGGMVSYVALPYQIYQLTRSNFAVGAMGLVELVPLVVFGLYGGALADHVDRRTMLVLTAMAQVLLTAGLLANSLVPDPQVWVIYVIGALLSVAQSLQRPSREALIPRTVRHDELSAAVAVSSLGMQIGTLLGPAIGGLLVGTVGVPWAYGVDVAGLAIATVLFLAMRAYPPTDRSTPPSLAGHRGGHPVRRRAPRPARHLRHRHDRDVPGVPDRAVPGAGPGRVRPAEDARAALYRRERGLPRRDPDQRLDQPVPSPRPGRRRRLDVLGRRHRAGRAGAVGVARAWCSSAWPGPRT